MIGIPKLKNDRPEAVIKREEVEEYPVVLKDLVNETNWTAKVFGKMTDHNGLLSRLGSAASKLALLCHPTEPPP